MAIVITDKMYVGYDMRQESKDETVKLGFATYVEDNAAFQKRKSTVDSWSKGYSWASKKEKNPPPEILDNELLEGFKIARSVRRHGWGSGNVLWRIEDPRGFELEISSANMASIMDCTTIVNGEIQSKCKWGWNTVGGSKVVLLPENSQPYLDALKDTERRNSDVIPLKDLKPGDQVELKNARKAKFLGSFHYLTVTNPDYNDCIKTWKSSDKKTFFFEDEESLFTVSRPQVISVTRAKNPMTIDQAVEYLNDALRQNRRVDALTGYGDNIVLVSTKQIDMSKVQLVLVDTTSENAFKESEYLSGKTWKHPPVFSRTARGLFRLLDNRYEKTKLSAYPVDESGFKDHTINPIGPSAWEWHRRGDVMRIMPSDMSKSSVTNYLHLMVSYDGKLYNPRTY